MPEVISLATPARAPRFTAFAFVVTVAVTPAHALSIGLDYGVLSDTTGEKRAFATVTFEDALNVVAAVRVSHKLQVGC